MADPRDLTIQGSFGDGELVLDRLFGHDSLSSPFEYTVELHSKDRAFDISSLVGDTVTVAFDIQGDQTRYINGYVTRMTRGSGFDDYAHYSITVRPWLFLLSSRVNSRIFQNQSVVDIVTAVFREHGFSDFEVDLSQTPGAREFVVQYRESDFAFVCRLLEREGIYYFFRHEESRHVLVLADSVSSHKTVTGYEAVLFHPEGGATALAGEFIDRWGLVHQWRSGSYASNDYDFQRPKADLTAQRQANVRHKKGDLEVFDYPAGFITQPDVESYVTQRLDALQSDVEVANGAGDVRGLGTGNLFTLADFPNGPDNKQYLIVSSIYDAKNNERHSGGQQVDGYFHYSFAAIDSQVPYRPARVTPMPRVEGVQTAVVVGESGDEITTDQYGRVKVQFRWDRVGKSDDNSSCWVRVAQIWAGSGWGGIHIPRIGQEVIVDFLEGDPDRPIITGRVYNADNMPPYTLPDNKTQSGIKSRSSQAGAPSNFNEIRFEDKKGSEELHVQAEKDETKLVKNNQSASIGVDRSLSVGGNETVSIGKNRTETVGTDESVTIGANQSLSVGGNRAKLVSGSETVSIGVASIETITAARMVTIGAAYQVSVGGAMNETVGALKSEQVAGASSETVGGNKSVSAGGNLSESVGGDITASAGKKVVLTAGDNFTISASQDLSGTGGKNVSVEAAEQLKLTCGDATIVLNKNGDITINGAKVQVTASGDLVLKGSKIAGN